MDQPSLVSILIPTYNRKNLVVNAINSALNQTYKNIEIIVSDNCSTDGTLDHLFKLYEKINNVKIFSNSHNSGPVINWINCIEKSSGRFSKILFSDDTIAPNYIEETINILRSHSDIGFVYAPALIQTSLKKKLFYNTYYSSKKIKSDKIENRFLIDFNVPVSPGAALFRKNDLINNINLSIQNSKGKDFNIYGAGTDLNIYLQLLKKYKYVYFTNKTKSFFYGGKTSFTVNNNLDYYYQTVRLNYLRTQKKSVKKILIKMLIKLKFTKLFNYLSSLTN